MFTQGSTSFKFNPNITSNQFAWAAVPANTQAVYRKWLVADGGGSGVPNSGLIGDVSSGGNTAEAWKRMRDAIVDGQQYYFYAMNFPAQINSNVTLSA